MNNHQVWDNFNREEFACQCGDCDENGIQDRFIDVLQEIRTAYGKPLVVTSGYRCANHPVERVKIRPGTHNLGLAADVAVSRGDAFRLVQIAMGHPDIAGLGVKQNGTGRFIHLDIVEDQEHFARPNLWSY